jgi:hypothetical protein
MQDLDKWERHSVADALEPCDFKDGVVRGWGVRGWGRRVRVCLCLWRPVSAGAAVGL